MKGKDTRYKLYRPGNNKGTAGVGVFVAEEWIEKVFEVQIASDRIILVKLIVGQHVITFLSVYAPQSGLSDEVKDLFFDQLRAMTARIPCGDWNGHVGRAEVFNSHVRTSAGVADAATEDIWKNIKTGLLKTTEEVCGTTRLHHWCCETWWWNEHVEKAIAAKRKAFKAWKAGKGTRASYNAAKCIARHAVHHACQKADKKDFENIAPKSSEVYRLANQFRRENADVVGNKPAKNDAGEMSMTEDSKQKAWLEYYQRLLKVEFDWDPDHLSDKLPVESLPIPITIDMVKKAISQMKAGKAPGPSGVVVEEKSSRLQWHLHDL